MSSRNTIKILPYHYIHILDRNTNVSRNEIGPQTYIILDNERLLTPQSLKMITLSRRQFVKIENPVTLENGAPTTDKHGQTKLNHGETEYRFWAGYPEPFFLYPGEIFVNKKIETLQSISQDSAYKVEAIRDFKDDEGVQRIAGDKWLVQGPATYYPKIEQKLLSVESAKIIQEGKAIKLKASQDLVDSSGTARKSGEEWIIKIKGAYMVGAYEIFLDFLTPKILNSKKAIIVSATQNFTDVYNIERKAGESWLISTKHANAHIIDVHEEFVNFA